MVTQFHHKCYYQVTIVWYTWHNTSNHLSLFTNEKFYCNCHYHLSIDLNCHDFQHRRGPSLVLLRQAPSHFCSPWLRFIFKWPTIPLSRRLIVALINHGMLLLVWRLSTTSNSCLLLGSQGIEVFNSAISVSFYATVFKLLFVHLNGLRTNMLAACTTIVKQWSYPLTRTWTAIKFEQFYS